MPLHMDMPFTNDLFAKLTILPLGIQQCTSSYPCSLCKQMSCYAVQPLVRFYVQFTACISSSQAEERLQRCQAHHLAHSILVCKLFRATAIVLDAILRASCPRCFGFNTLPSILQQLTEFLQQLPDDPSAFVHNQDVVGFTSIPVFRMLNAVRWAVNEYCLCKNIDVQTASASVDLREQDQNYVFGEVVLGKLLNVLC